MKIEVHVFATLRRYLPELSIGEAKIVSVEPGTTLAEIRDMLGLPAEEVKVIMCNSLQAELSDVPADGDRIAYIPAVAGG